MRDVKYRKENDPMSERDDMARAIDQLAMGLYSSMIETAKVPRKSIGQKHSEVDDVEPSLVRKPKLRQCRNCRFSRPEKTGSGLYFCGQSRRRRTSQGMLTKMLVEPSWSCSMWREIS